ncbi:hypothetical protein JM83_3873 [Gillisia sp. Hel_I_86]|nr:hypothetical protein [Gillisia sp. Hel_I_86]TVZ28726.1 hypothetical protein JM83_3873 [Gillisia sp. Hel_I_86]
MNISPQKKNALYKSVAEFYMEDAALETVLKDEVITIEEKELAL